MRNIQKLIDVLMDETGIIAELRVYPGPAGWVARVVEDGEVLLCPAGERYLSVAQGADAADAVVQLDNIVKQGFELAASWA